MGYPDYPYNRLIVNNIDLTNEFKMVLSDGYTLEPPEPKTYTIDIPGGNGKLDLTETLIGDTLYDNRTQEFTFYVIHPDSFEKVKTKVSNFLHGKSYDYHMTMDPDYTYHGRFKVTGYSHGAYSSGIVGIIKVSIDANPYKMKPKQVFKVNAVGGVISYLPSGRMRVRPDIEVDSLTKIIYNNKLLVLPQGSWVINDLLFTEGVNEVYFNSYDIINLQWKDLKTNGVTWGSFKQQRLYEWYKSNGDGTYVIATWEYMTESKWSDIVDKAWVDLTYKSETTNLIKNIYVNYEWGDL